MGETLSQIIKDSKINIFFSFLVPYLSTEVIALIDSINEDDIFDKETFCSFFRCSEREFKLLTSSIELVNFHELMVVIYLLKSDTYKSKVSNIVNLFIYDDSDFLFTADTFLYMKEVFVNSLLKLFSVTMTADDEMKLEEELKTYIISLFKSKNMNEIKVVNMIKFIEEDTVIYNLLNYVDDEIIKNLKFNQ